MSTTATFAPQRLACARLGVGLIFLANGASFASLVPRLPEVKDELDLSNSVFGLAVAAFPFGALVAGLFAGVLIRRFGSQVVAWAGMMLAMLAILGAAAAPSLALFGAAIFMAGASDSITDVAQNHHALRVQKLMKRSIINSYHAMWSVGALMGGVLGGAALAIDLPRLAHLAIVAVLLLTVTTIGWKKMLPGPEHEVGDTIATDTSAHEGANRAWLKHPVIVLAALSVLALAGAVIEENPGTWATLYMRNELGQGGSMAVAAYIAAMAMHFLGRVTGDPLVNRFGQRRMAFLGGTLAAVGMGLAIAVPTPWTTVLGYAMAGYGIATVIPSVFEAADAMPGLKPGTALTVTSLVLRVGFLVSPPLVGLIADATSLRWGLLVVPASGLLVLALAWVLSPAKDALDTPVAASR